MFSPLANRVMETGKRSSRGGTAITRAIVHHWAGTGGGIERLVQSSDEASVHYLILSDGSLIASVPEEYRAWTSGSFEADASAITFEVQNTTTAPEWRVSDAAIATLTRTIADIARRYGWGSVSRDRVRGHREFYATECPGPYLYPRLGQIAADAHNLLTGGVSVVTMASPVVGTVSCEWRGYEGHAGMDIACDVGTPVRAMFAGIVREAGWNVEGTGRTGIGIRIENPDGESQYYGHLSGAIVRPGDWVTIGQKIGLSGATGNVTGPHLHLECWESGGTYWNGLDRDPREWFDFHGVVPGSDTGHPVEEIITIKFKEKNMKLIRAKGNKSIAVVCEDGVTVSLRSMTEYEAMKKVIAADAKGLLEVSDVEYNAVMAVSDRLIAARSVGARA